MTLVLALQRAHDTAWKGTPDETGFLEHFSSYAQYIAERSNLNPAAAALPEAA